MLKTLIVFLGILFWILIVYFYVKSVMLFLIIKVKSEQRSYKGFIIENINFLTKLSSINELKFYLPIAFFFKDNVPYRNIESIKLLWERKFAYERAFFIIMILGGVMIPVIEFFLPG